MFYKLYRTGIYAVPLPGGGSLIIEKMPEVLATLTAQELDSFPAVGIQEILFHIFPYMEPETGETRP